MEYPESSPVALGQVRKRAVVRFPYMVVYSARDGGIHVSAVDHLSRTLERRPPLSQLWSPVPAWCVRTPYIPV